LKKPLVYILTADCSQKTADELISLPIIDIFYKLQYEEEIKAILDRLKVDQEL
jgi:sulfur transfer protein SufE